MKSGVQAFVLAEKFGAAHLLVHASGGAIAADGLQESAALGGQPDAPDAANQKRRRQGQQAKRFIQILIESSQLKRLSGVRVQRSWLGNRSMG